MKHYWEHPAILMYLCFWRCIAPSFIQVNLGLSVPKGQSAFLSKEDLQFNVPKEKDSCKVEVVMNEPITQRVGKLTPQVFDCHFLANEVKYTHNGCPILDEDQVMLRLYRFTETETFTETFILKVHLLDSDCNIIQLGSTSLEVPEFYGFSNIIDRNVLTFVYDVAMNLDCTVHITTQDTLLPAYGQLVMGKPPEGPVRGDQPNSFLQIMKKSSKEKSSQNNLKDVHALEVNCEEFLVLGLHYQHLRPPSPDVDYITISLELVDSRSKNVHKRENAWIPVRIRNAFPNLSPKASFIAMYILEVDQFILTPITTHTLDGEDSESPKTQLVFNVTKPPLQGFITHLSDHTKPITSFTWIDLNEMLIAFQPPNNSHTERRNYEVEFEVHDFYFRNSAPIMVHISIRTTDTNAPRVSWNMGLDLLEGQSRTITWEQFQVVDNDALSAVRLITVDGLLHGRLTVRGGKGFMFTVDDIKSGVVHYHHDDSDSTNDFIVFRIFDGNHSTRHKFPINILPKDDSPPFLINNVILELYEDQEIQIEKVMLQASDMDSSDDYILFKIIKPPQAGEILKRTAPELSGYPITRFQQSDLFNARIYYRHLGSEVFEDSFEFILSDSHEPPNLSDPQTVIIHITPVDDQLPKEAPWALRHLVVKETEIAHLTKNQLYFTDAEIPDGEIVYAITAGPFFTSVLGLSDAGKLFLTDSMKKLTKKSNVPMLRSFTQHAVNYLKVAYMPPIQDIGPDPQHVQFLFSVSNQHGGILIGLCFNITVLPVDNQAPEILTKQLDVDEGGVGQITVDHILVMDVDTKDHQIKIVLQKQPVHGVVKVDGDPMIEGDIFNLEDLGQLKISYNHDDSETRHDEVTFSATDGSNSAECVLQIQILPVNDEPPTMKPGLKPMMYCLEGAEVAITAENLYATDLDSDDERLMFMIARQPFHGAVQKDSQIIDHFSQADILSGSVTYIHTGGEVGLTPCFDTITFVISDWDGGTVEGCCSEEPFSPLLSIHNSLPVYDLNITIMPINNQPPTIIIGETFIVDEGLSAAITVGHLCASDLDTANDELTFVLWSSPQFGYIENTLPSPGYEKSNVGISIDSFDMKHIKDFHINYVQFHHQQIEPTADQFMLYVTDGQHQSAAVPFYIIIQPTNDEPPSFLARNITVSEGQVRELDPSIINVADLDLPTDSLVFIIKQQPNHGKIVNGNDIIQYKHQIHSHEEHLVHDFTMDQLKHGMKLMYKHDDSETKTDSFTIQVSDGKHTVHKVIQVTILPVNDEKPLLSRNNELEVEIGDSRIISSVVLEAEDKDTSRQHVYYVMDSAPKQGVLQIKEGRDWIPLHPGMNCSQDDIDMNRLRYIHTGAIGSNGRDSFHFHLSDGDHRSSVHRFQIFIQNIEKGEITIFLKPLTIFKGERGILTTAVLLASDGSNKPEELLYVITMPPSYGQVEYITYPGVTITSFSQMDVAAQAVSYTHKSTVTATSDSLRFIVSNGLSTRNGSLEIIIENIDRILPTLLNNKGIRLVEGSMVSISPDVLQLSDPDTPPQNLTYIIAQQPQHGQLHLKGAVLKQHNFTQLDVDSMDIAYKHDGGDSQIDRFTFVVTDMTNHGFLVNGVLHTEPSVFTIQVDHKDKAFPRIVYLQCPSQVEVFKNQKYGIYISSRHLKASDRDSKDEELIYHILREPNIGYLENVTTGGFIWNKFTQKDLNSRNIIYIISASSTVMSDSLEFQVSDSSGNSALPQILDLKWSRIEMMESEYRVCEDVGLFSVKVLRTGYFMDSAFVGIKVNSISALVGKDFTHSSANLIQFDPGVSVKSWNIVITNDKLEENEETFEVLLTLPINAVLGAKAKILIKIIDGEKDRCNLAFMNDRNEENPPGRVLRERLASGSSTSPNLKSNSSLVEGMAMTNLHEDLKKSQGDVMQQFPLKPPSKKKLMYHGVIALKVEGDHSPSVYNRRATVVITSQSQQHFLGKTELSQTDKVTTVPASQQIPVQQEPSSKICPSGWTYHDDRCYYLNTKHKATWTGAARACKEMYHGNLVSVISKQDMEWLWDFSGRRSFWIGLNDRISPGKWNWAGGEHVSFTNWKRGLPPTSRKKGKNCVLVRRRGKWEVKNCKQGKPHYYMCSVR